MNRYASWSQQSTPPRQTVRARGLPWSAGCPALGGLSGGCFWWHMVGVQSTCGTLELAGPNSDLAAHRTPFLVLLWCLQRDWMGSSPHPGNLRTRLARASGSHAALRSATRTDSDQNHTSQALELAAGGCGNTSSTVLSSALLIHAHKLPVSPLAAPGGALVSHTPVRWLQRLCSGGAPIRPQRRGCYITIKWNRKASFRVN